jgi:hypothetical protein
VSASTVIKMSIQRMICTGCGAEANASCNCGQPYVPKAVRVIGWTLHKVLCNDGEK